MKTTLVLIPLLPLLGFFLNGGIAIQRARGRGFFGTKLISTIGCVFPLAAFALSLKVFLVLLMQDLNVPITASHLMSWMALNDFTLNFGLSVDNLSALMLLIVTGVGSIIHIYSIGYMREDNGYARYMSYLNLFLFFMTTLVMADSLPFLFVGWEGVGLTSYLLIGFWYSDKEKASAGKKAFIVNRIGDFGFIIAMMVIVAVFISESDKLGESPLSKNFLDIVYLEKNSSLLQPHIALITLCLFFAATGKSAQIPLSVWLPDAMAGPTPVSALIHAATMVTAGVYLVARLAFLFVMAPFTLHVIATIGLLTAFMAALIAVTQYDIKKVLAYSTVSQLGYMFLALGLGAFSPAIFHLVTHAFFKAGLFLCAGAIIHGLHHEQDIRFMGGLRKKMPKTAITFLIFALAISGFPPLSGFFSKDEILAMVFTNAPSQLYYILALATSGLTAFYITRLYVYTFLGKTRHEHAENIREATQTMSLSLITLAIAACLVGFIGLPHAFGPSWITPWLKLPDSSPAHDFASSQELTLMFVSTVVAIGSAAFAFFLYRRDLATFSTVKRRCRFIYAFVSKKFKIDEFYNVTLVRPLQVFSEKILYRIVDVGIIDGLVVNGLGHMSRFVGKSLSFLQTGLLGNYLLYLLVALLTMLFYFLYF